MGSTRAWLFLGYEDGKTVIPNRVMQVLIAGRVGDRVLTPSAIRVYLALRSRTFLRRREATEDELRAVTGLDRRSVRRSLMELWEVGLVEVGQVGYYAPPDPTLREQTMPGPIHPVQDPVHPMPQGPLENALPEGTNLTPEIREESKEKEHHHHSHGPRPVGEEEVCQRTKPSPLPREDEVVGLAYPHGHGEVDRARKGAPDHVNISTKPLQEALRRVGLWGDFYHLFRPAFAQESLWVRYLRRLEADALPLGETFLQAVAKTVEGATRGVVRYPTAYLEALLREAEAARPSPASSPGTETPGPNPHLDGRELLLPDGRRGYFAGWTQGGRKGFLEVEGVALLLDRETILALPVLG